MNDEGDDRDFTDYLLPNGSVSREYNQVVSPEHNSCAFCGKKSSRLLRDVSGRWQCVTCAAPIPFRIVPSNVLRATTFRLPFEAYDGLPQHPEDVSDYACAEEHRNSAEEWARRPALPSPPEQGLGKGKG